MISDFFKSALVFGLVVALCLMILVPQFSLSSGIGRDATASTASLNSVLSGDTVNGDLVLVRINNAVSGGYTVTVQDPSGNTVASPTAYITSSGLYTETSTKDVHGKVISYVYRKTDQSK